MTKKERIEERTWAIMQEKAAELGLIPVDAEYVRENGQYRLIVTVGKDEGIGINDCEAMSRAIDPILDEEDYIPDVYTLEVTSPGLGRVLRRPRDFVYGLGREVEVHTYRAVNKQKAWTGILSAVTDETVTITTAEGGLALPRTDISLIKLTFDF